MRKILVAMSALTLAACGSMQKDAVDAQQKRDSAPTETYERRDYDNQQRREAAVNRALEQAPRWMSELPTSNSAVFANGSAVSGDLAMADNKAKMIAYAKICMSAGGRVDQRSRTFISDSGDSSYESSEMAIRSMCPGVDITGVEIREIKRVSENGRYRSFVLVALPMNNANPLQQRRDQLNMRNQANKRSEQMFNDMDRNKE